MAHLPRYSLGALISVVAVLITLQRVDVDQVLQVLARASILPIFLAVGCVLAEVAIRARRWQLLLRPMARVSYGLSVAYLCIGYLANAILPARLGDVARAYLAGTALRIRRTTTLGTILVERVSDGLLMLGVVLLAGSLVPNSGPLLLSALSVAAIGVLATMLLFFSLTGVRRSRVAHRPMWAIAESIIARLWAGTIGVRSATGTLVLVVHSVAALFLAVTVMLSTADAVGVRLSPVEGLLVTAGLALSLSIPAGPGALGTYEFVGLTIVSALGIPPPEALATVVLHHAIVAIPPALAGVVATLVLHVRVGAITSDADRMLDEASPPVGPPGVIPDRSLGQ